MSRRFRQPGVSFFAFQDIITAVVGIVILITLVMVLELLDKVDAESRTPPGDAAVITRLINQTKADADEMEEQLDRLQQQQQRENQGIVLSATVTEESLRQQIEEQSARNERVAAQVSAVRRQVEDSEQRHQAALVAANSQLHQLDSQREQLQSTLEDITGRTEKLQADDWPLYNDTLADGRSLVIIRLGNHPDSAAAISMREGDRRSVRKFHDIDDVINAVKHRDQLASHYMVLIAPGGASDFTRLRDYFDSTRMTDLFGSRDLPGSIRYGFDVIGADDDIKLVFEMDEQ